MHLLDHTTRSLANTISIEARTAVMTEVSMKPFGREWMANYFHMVDRLNPFEFVTWYTDDAVFRSGNSAPVIGHAAIIASLESFYAVISTMSHEMTGVWVDKDSGVFEAIAHYTTKDGRSFELPAMTSLRVKGNRIHQLLFVMDASPLFQPIPRANHDR